jgi:NAD(P)-dependent dehydrogenase (short-subunit alcohol dehydrogenase family)
MVRGLAQAGATVLATAARETAELEALSASEAGHGRIVALQADVTRLRRP